MVVNLPGSIYSATLFTFRLTMPGYFFILRSQGTRMQILPSIRLNQGHPRSHSSSGSRPRLECIIHAVTGTLAYDSWAIWRSHHCFLLKHPSVWPHCWNVFFTVFALDSNLVTLRMSPRGGTSQNSGRLIQ